MPGRFITDRQYEDYMKLRTQYTQNIAAVKAGFSSSTGSRIDRDPRPPSQKKQERRHGGGKPDPLAGIWEEVVVPLLEKQPHLRPFAILDVARHCSCKCATLKAGDGDGLQNVNLVHSFQGSILFFGVVLSSLFLALERVSSSMSLSDIAAA